jgi:hypothetical protein
MRDLIIERLSIRLHPSGRVRSWIKVKNPASPAMLRIIEEGAWQ